MKFTGRSARSSTMLNWLPLAKSRLHQRGQFSLSSRLVVFQSGKVLHDLSLIHSTATAFDEFAKFALLPLLRCFRKLGVDLRGCVSRPTRQITRRLHRVTVHDRLLRVS